ncbi:MAG: diacylglycerol kinase family lipid kinase [Lysobacterales bacterium]
MSTAARRKLALVFNPSAGAGRSARLLDSLLARLERFAEISLHRTTEPADATRWLADADLDGFDGVLAAGGDGTLFETVNGLFARPPECRPALGIIPIGTGNAFSRDLGLQPGDWRSAVGLIENGRTRRFDVGCVQWASEEFYFLNIAGAGLPVDIMRIMAPYKHLGPSSYSLVTLWKALQMKCYPLRVTVDGRVIERECLFVEVSNTRYTGTSFMIAPAAKPDDGRLDVTLVGRLSRPRVLRLFPSVYTGRHVDFEEVETVQGEEIRIESDGPLDLAADGELQGATPAVIRCLPRSLEVFAAP